MRLTRYYGDGEAFDRPPCATVSCAELEKLETEVERLRAFHAADHWDPDLQAYRQAPGGEGPHAATWKDKPHRLIYDLCGAVQRLRAEKSIVETQRDAARLRDNAAMVSSLEDEVERLKVALDGARKMACDLCSSGVPLRADGYHDSDGSLQWCDARADEELRPIRPSGEVAKTKGEPAPPATKDVRHLAEPFRSES